MGHAAVAVPGPCRDCIRALFPVRNPADGPPAGPCPSALAGASAEITLSLRPPKTPGAANRPMVSLMVRDHVHGHKPLLIQRKMMSDLGARPAAVGIEPTLEWRGESHYRFALLHFDTRVPEERSRHRVHALLYGDQ